MFDLPDVTRHITGYSKVPDRHGAYLAEVDYEFALPVPLIFLQKLFNIDPNDPDEGNRYLIDCYDIDEKKAEALQPFVKEKLDLNKFYFQLECSDKESYEAWKEEQENGYQLNENDLIRFIAAYPYEPDENGEMWEQRFALQKPISLEFLRKIFPEYLEENELVTSREIHAEQAKALQPYFKEKLDLERYAIYLSCTVKKTE